MARRFPGARSFTSMSYLVCRRITWHGHVIMQDCIPNLSEALSFECGAHFPDYSHVECIRIVSLTLRKLCPADKVFRYIPPVTVVVIWISNLIGLDLKPDIKSSVLSVLFLCSQLRDLKPAPCICLQGSTRGLTKLYIFNGLPLCPLLSRIFSSHPVGKMSVSLKATEHGKLTLSYSFLPSGCWLPSRLCLLRIHSLLHSVLITLVITGSKRWHGHNMSATDYFRFNPTLSLIACVNQFLNAPVS